jgi:hypothetical protein
MYRQVLEYRKVLKKDRVRPEDLSDDPQSLVIYRKPKAELLAAALERHAQASGQVGKSDDRIQEEIRMHEKE